MMRVLITRPSCFTTPLSEKIQALPAIPLFFPVLELQPLVDQKKVLHTLQLLPTMDYVIFSSQAAVHFFLNIMAENACNLPALTWMAIGKSTALAFQNRTQELGYAPVACIYPHPPFESESLLAEPILQNIQNKKILIIRGQTGRRLLPEMLHQRGANVIELAVFERRCPKISPLQVEQSWQNLKPDVIVTTSADGLKNLVTLLGEKNWQIYSKLPMIVVGERMQRLALTLQVAEPLIAEGADDEALITVLHALRSRYT